eukprot:4225482-Pleurochrysis_carterae.AAC.1
MYWIWGHHALRLVECSNVTSISHASHISFAPACAATLSVAARVASSSTSLMSSGLRRAITLDADVHDAFIDAVNSAPAAVASFCSRAFATRPAMTSPFSDATRDDTKCPVAPSLPKPRGSLSAPFFTSARAMLATGARGNSPRRSRHLKK